MKDNSRDWTWDTLDNSWGHEEKDRLFRPSELQLQGCSARILTTWREKKLVPLHGRAGRSKGCIACPSL